MPDTTQWELPGADAELILGDTHAPGAPVGVVCIVHGFLGYKDYGMFPCLADQMAQDPEAMKKAFVPDSDQVIWATPLVNGKGQVEREFIAPEQSIPTCPPITVSIEWLPPLPVQPRTPMWPEPTVIVLSWMLLPCAPACWM